MIRVETCDSANAGELLRIIGYRMRGGCGSEVVLETVNATLHRSYLVLEDLGFTPEATPPDNVVKLRAATPILSAAVEQGKLKVVGGIYRLKDGEVDMVA